MGKIIITGVDGQFGAMAAQRILKEEPKENLIFTTENEKVLHQYQEMGVDARHCDYNDPSSVEKSFAGGKNLLMISMPIVGPARIAMYKNAVDAAVKSGVERIIYTSIVSSGDDTCDALVKDDHDVTEAMIKNSGLKYIICRNSQYAEAMVYYSLPDAYASGVWPTNQGGGKMAYISLIDCAKAATELVRGRGENNTTYNITGPQLLTLENIAEIVLKVTGRKIKVMQISDEETYEQFDAIGVPRSTDNGMQKSPLPWCSDDMVSFGRAVREGKMDAFTTAFYDLVDEPMITMKDIITKAYKEGIFKVS